MPVSSAARLLEVLLAVSMLLQTLEYLRIRHAFSLTGLWAWPVQRADIPTGAVQKLLDLLFADRAMLGHLLLRLPVLLWLAWHGSDLALALFLFVSHVLMLIRWRGAFNGGSDFMTLVVLTGLLYRVCQKRGVYNDGNCNYNNICYLLHFSRLWMC